MRLTKGKHQPWPPEHHHVQAMDRDSFRKPTLVRSWVELDASSDSESMAHLAAPEQVQSGQGTRQLKHVRGHHG